MEQNISDNGNKGKLEAKANLFMWMVIYIKVNGKMIKPMVMEYMFIKMEQNIQDIGNKTYRKVMVFFI